MRYEGLIQDLGIDTGTVVPPNRYTTCPICGHTRKATFSINQETGLWVCFKCDERGNLAQLISVLESCTVVQALFKIDEYEHGVSVREATHERLMDVLTGPTFAVGADEERAFTRDTALSHAHWPEWWPERGFNIDDWVRWDCASDPATGDVSIPVYQGTALAGEIRRRPEGSVPKYLYSTGMHKSKLLFGEHLLERGEWPLVVTEGSLDAIWVWHAGMEAVSLLGAYLSATQRQLLVDRRRPVVLALDADEEGQKGTLRAVHALMGLVPKLSAIRLPAGVKDIQEVRDEGVVRGLINEAPDAVMRLLEES